MENHKRVLLIGDDEDDYVPIRSFFENSFDAIFLTIPEKGSQILAANPEACRMFGYTEEEFWKPGRNEIVDTTDPRCRQFLEEVIQNVRVSFTLAVEGANGSS